MEQARKDALCNVRLMLSVPVFSCIINTLFLLQAAFFFSFLLLMTLYFTLDFKLPSITTSFFFQFSSSLPGLLCVVPDEHRPIQQVTLEIATKSNIFSFRDSKVTYELNFQWD